MFTQQELQSLYNLLRRSTFNGLEEARAAVVLAHKIEQALKQLAEPK